MVYDVNKLGYEGGEYKAVMKGNNCLAITQQGENVDWILVGFEKSVDFQLEAYVSGYIAVKKYYDCKAGMNYIYFPYPTLNSTNEYVISSYDTRFDKVDFSRIKCNGKLKLVSYKVKDVILPETPPEAISVIFQRPLKNTLDLTNYTCYGAELTDTLSVKFGKIGGDNICIFIECRAVDEVGEIGSEVNTLYLKYMNNESIYQFAMALGEQNRGINIEIEMRDGEELATDVRNLLIEKGANLR